MRQAFFQINFKKFLQGVGIGILILAFWWLSVRAEAFGETDYRVEFGDEWVPIDYDEFNAKTIELSEKIYQQRHSKIKDKKDGLYRVNRSTSPATNVFRVIVEAGIYENILNSLEQYKVDLKEEYNYQVEFYLCNDCTKEEIKAALQTAGTVGTVFVGDLPSAWFRIEDCFHQEGRIEIFPIDLYFMDLNGQWAGEVDCGSGIRCFTTHTGDTLPEIFFGRLTAPNESQEVELLNHYFEKNHQYKQGEIFLPRRSLNYINTRAMSWVQEVNIAYPVYDLITGPETTNGNDYKNRWNDGYEHLLVAVHSTPLEHFFIPSAPNGSVTWEDVKTLKPHFHFYNLLACSNARFTTENYMAGWYVFQKSDYGLLAIGSTKAGEMRGLSYFYQPLSEFKHFGLAFKEWFRLYQWAVNDKCWHGGMTLIGDPTLKISPFSNTPTPTPTPTPITSSLSCSGGCYSSNTNCQNNCGQPCTKLDQTNAAQQGCWPSAYRCCQTNIPITPTPTPPVGQSPTPTPTSITPSLSCSGGCYSSPANCQKNCDQSCTRLDQANATQQGCWLNAYRCCQVSSPVAPTPTPTPTPITSSLSCSGGCYSSNTNCQNNCGQPCTKLDQTNAAQQGCWPSAYRCCQTITNN